MSDISGFWYSSGENEYYIEEFTGGFDFQNLSNGATEIAYYDGVESGYLTYITRYKNGGYALYVVISRNEITVYLSSKLDKPYTWKRQEVNKKNLNRKYAICQNQLQTKKKCKVCNGSGTSEETVPEPGDDSNKPDKYCPQCKKLGRPHRHMVCYSCGGLGVK
jgi:DnaJ-class molecular chaperone